MLPTGKRYLKKLRDNIPDPLKTILGPVFRNLLVRNKLFLDTYNSLIQREGLSEPEIKKNQFNKLKNILIYSYQFVPYYKTLFDAASFDPFRFSDTKEMEKIPFLNRELIRENYDQLISNQKVKGGHYIATTGGSSGIPLKILLDYYSVYQENAFIYYYRRKLGYKFGDKLATFRGVEFDKRPWKPNPMYREMLFSPLTLSRVTVHQYAEKINEYAPDYINGYLSAIWYFARLLKEENIKLSPKLKGIFLMSENVDLQQRQYIEEFFGVKSITHYGHSERCILAEEKIQEGYYFDPYYGYAEQVPTGNNQFAIVGTGFLNYTMPLIRYQTDDICTLEGKYYKIDGKRSSKTGLVGYNNEFITSSAFDLENEVFKNITNYQFIQNEIGKADLLIVVNKQFGSREFEIVKNEIKRTTKGVIDLNVIIVDNLVLSPRGKFQMYISNIKQA